MLWVLVSSLLGGVLLLAGVPKLRDSEGVLASVKGYRLLPEPLEHAVARALPAVETAVGAMLVLGLVPRAAATVATGLFLAFFGALAANLLRGRRDLDCGCFAFATGHDTPRIGWWHASRALVLAIGSAAVALHADGVGAARTPWAEHGAGVALAAVILAAVVAAVQLQTVVNPGRRTVDAHLSRARSELRAASSALSHR